MWFKYRVSTRKYYRYFAGMVHYYGAGLRGSGKGYDREGFVHQETIDL
jgi:hypothetical protein